MKQHLINIGFIIIVVVIMAAGCVVCSKALTMD